MSPSLALRLRACQGHKLNLEGLLQLHLEDVASRISFDRYPARTRRRGFLCRAKQMIVGSELAIAEAPSSLFEVTALNFLQVRPHQPGSPGLSKLVLGLFAARSPANARALVGIDEHAGNRPAPTLAGRAANLLLERAD